MTWIKTLRNLGIIIFSIILSFFTVELLYRAYLNIDSTQKFQNRSMLFQMGDNFENKLKFFKYFPNKKIRSLTYYSRPNPSNIDDIKIEYEYDIQTNNMGLVMMADVKDHTKVTYVVGDSFTEGQGASPWFYELEKIASDYEPQLVNLGILGTGPKQWLNLVNFITSSKNLIINGLIVNIIPNDITRSQWIFKEQQITCLRTGICDYQFGFQGFDFNPKEDHVEIRARIFESMIKANSDYSISFNNRIKNIVKKSKIVVAIYKLIKRKSWYPVRRLANYEALLELRKIADNNIFINVVSQKSINSSNYKHSSDASNLIIFLNKEAFQSAWCDIPSNGFHTIDPHPNSLGYQSLMACTRKAIKIINK